MTNFYNALTLWNQCREK